jgi:hypothetical protein
MFTQRSLLQVGKKGACDQSHCVIPKAKYFFIFPYFFGDQDKTLCKVFPESFISAVSPLTGYLKSRYENANFNLNCDLLKLLFHFILDIFTQ